MELYNQGRHEVFEQLIHRYERELLNFLVRFMGDRPAAEDVFQEAFLQVHLSAKSFDPSRRFKPWLFTIAANKARDAMRKKARRPAAQLDAPVGASTDETITFADLLSGELNLPQQILEKDELAQRVRRTIDQMPEHLREILLLAYFQQFAYAEIADVLQIPLGTVKSRLHTAVGAFAKKWKSLNKDTHTT
ncbi:MAG: RNA polymerase sigma factor [Planctomycetota bacterium]